MKKILSVFVTLTFLMTSLTTLFASAQAPDSVTFDFTRDDALEFYHFPTNSTAQTATLNASEGTVNIKAIGNGNFRIPMPEVAQKAYYKISYKIAYVSGDNWNGNMMGNLIIRDSTGAIKDDTFRNHMDSYTQSELIDGKPNARFYIDRTNGQPNLPYVDALFKADGSFTQIDYVIDTAGSSGDKSDFYIYVDGAAYPSFQVNASIAQVTEFCFDSWNGLHPDRREDPEFKLKDLSITASDEPLYPTRIAPRFPMSKVEWGQDEMGNQGTHTNSTLTNQGFVIPYGFTNTYGWENSSIKTPGIFELRSPSDNHQGNVFIPVNGLKDGNKYTVEFSVKMQRDPGQERFDPYNIIGEVYGKTESGREEKLVWPVVNSSNGVLSFMGSKKRYDNTYVSTGDIFADGKEYTKIKYIFKTDTSTIDIFVDDQLICENGSLDVSFDKLSKIKFGREWADTGAIGTLWLKDVSFASDVIEGPTANSCKFTDEYGVGITSVTAGQKIKATVNEIGHNASAAKIVFKNAQGTVTGDEIFINPGEIKEFIPTELGSYEIQFVNNNSEIVETFVLPVLGGLETLNELKNKGELNVAYIGGSITEGAGASSYTDRWTTKLTRWMNSLDLGTTTFKEINAGVGGTASTYGLLRLNRDVIAHNPDIVFIEFSLNDENLQEQQSVKAYEGIIRQLMLMPKVPYVICVGVVANRTNPTRAAKHREIANHYGLQFIDLQEYMDNRLGAAKPGSNPERDRLYNNDNTHPNSEGYNFYTEYLKTVINSGSMNKPAASKPFNNAYYKYSGNFINAATMDRTGAWTAYGSGNWNERNLGSNGSGLKSSNPSSKLTYKFTGPIAVIGHRIGKNFGEMAVSVDNGPERIINCYYDTNNQPVTWFEELELADTEHTITIRPTGNKNPNSSASDIKVDFLIVSSENTVTPSEPETEVETINCDLNSGELSTGSSNSTWTVDENGVGTLDIKNMDFYNPRLEIKINGLKENECYSVKYKLQLPEDSMGISFYNAILDTSKSGNLIRPVWAGKSGSGNRWDFYFVDWQSLGTGVHNDSFWLAKNNEPNNWADVEYLINTVEGTVYVKSSNAPEGLLMGGDYTSHTGTKDIGVPTVLRWAGDGINQRNDVIVKVKDVSVSSFKAPRLNVVSSTIANGSNDAQVSDNAVLFNLKFNAKLADNIILSDYITINNGADIFEAELITNDTIRVKILNAKPKKNYTVAISKNIPLASGQKNNKGFSYAPMAEDYTLLFRTQVPGFDVISVLGSDNNEITDLSIYKGQNLNFNVTFRNNSLDNMPNLQAFAVLVDPDGRMVAINHIENAPVAIGTEFTKEFVLAVPNDDKIYKLEIFTWTDDGCLRPLYEKIVLPQ